RGRAATRCRNSRVTRLTDRAVSAADTQKSPHARRNAEVKLCRGCCRRARAVPPPGHRSHSPWIPMTVRPAKILLVDDDAATRPGLLELLIGAGYETRAVATFEEGIRALRVDTPDLLIADVRLGAFNGLQLLVSSPRSVPAIVITGFADPVLESDARQHGADYVLKPVTPSVLLDMVRRALAQRENVARGK